MRISLNIYIVHALKMNIRCSISVKIQIWPGKKVLLTEFSEATR